MYKREQTLSYVRAMRSFNLFSPLLKGHQFHARQLRHKMLSLEFFFLTYQTYDNSNALFNLRLLLVYFKKPFSLFFLGYCLKVLVVDCRMVSPSHTATKTNSENYFYFLYFKLQLENPIPTFATIHLGKDTWK